jgi:hypothetical protein
MWFRAMWYVTSQKNGASALGLQRVLGLGSYQTAWAWLHKLRRVMVRPGRDTLSGWIEVDETYVGGWEEGMKGRRRGLRFFRRCLTKLRLAGRRRFPNGKTATRGSKEGGLEYTGWKPGAKMEIPGLWGLAVALAQSGIVVWLKIDFNLAKRQF